MQTTSLQRAEKGKGRHPLLRTGSLAHRIHLYIKKHGAATYTVIADGLGEKAQSVNGQLQRMKGEGLIIALKRQKGNRVVSVYDVVRENETGHARDKVEIESLIYVNEFGEYSVKSRIVGALSTAHEDNPEHIHTVRHYAAVPKPSEPFKTRVEFTGPVGTKNSENVVLEGDLSDTPA